MLDLVGKLAIVRSTTFYDRYLLVWITKETPNTITIRAWSRRASDWESETRRNDKSIVKIVHRNAAMASADSLSHLAQQMVSYEANTQERISKAKKDLALTMEKAELK